MVRDGIRGVTANPTIFARAIEESVDYDEQFGAIVSLARYSEVIRADLTGLERFAAAGGDVATVHSVASFFVSRVDTEADRRLEGLGTDEARSLLGRAAVAQAKLAYQMFLERFSG